MKRIFAILTALVMVFGSLVQAHAALIPIDVGGDLMVYDDVNNKTWVQDADLLGALVTWTVANDWAQSLSFGGGNTWRLPTTIHPDDTCNDKVQSLGYNCTGSELGDLYTKGLGGVQGCGTGFPCPLNNPSQLFLESLERSFSGRARIPLKTSAVRCRIGDENAGQ